MPDVSHRLQSSVSTINSVRRTHSGGVSVFDNTTVVISFDAIGTYLVLQRVLSSCVYCILSGRYSWSRIRTYCNTYMMSLFFSHKEVDCKSVVIDYCTTVLQLMLYTIHFGEGNTGISCMCSSMEFVCEKTFRGFQGVILTYQVQERTYS